LTGTLIDTQALLWFISAPARLSAVALDRITAPGAELFFSYASAWEIVIKHANGKLTLPSEPEPFLIGQLTINKIRLMPISIGSIFRVGQLPLHHKDPFDRLIAAQCLRHDLTLISIDQAFDAYGVRRAW
jgi:PIN domain nuclease of toxin-antitoxin system